MSKGILITGTGTDVGKTMLTTGLLRLCLRRGKDVMLMKPVQTGAMRGADGKWAAPDICSVQVGSGLIISPEEMTHACPYLFEPACSPHLAARLAGTTIQLDRIVAGARELQARHEMLIVETAGGVMAPLNDTQTTLDLAAALGLPVILVGHSGLGTINHVLLSLMAMRSRKLNILGVVLNDTRPPEPDEQYIRNDNVHAIEAFGGVKVIARLPYLGTPPDLTLLDKSLVSLEGVFDEL